VPTISSATHVATIGGTTTITGTGFGTNPSAVVVGLKGKKTKNTVLHNQTSIYTDVTAGMGLFLLVL
jgi:hypothetical protein